MNSEKKLADKKFKPIFLKRSELDHVQQIIEDDNSEKEFLGWKNVQEIYTAINKEFIKKPISKVELLSLIQNREDIGDTIANLENTQRELQARFEQLLDINERRDRRIDKIENLVEQIENIMNKLQIST